MPIGTIFAFSRDSFTNSSPNMVLLKCDGSTFV